MPKQIMIKDDVLKKLDEIREEKQCSYSSAINFLFGYKPEEINIWMLQVNKNFFELGGMFPDMKGIFEVMRIIAIQFNQLPIETKASYIEVLSRKFEDILEHIIRIKVQNEEGDGDEKKGDKIHDEE